MHRSSNHPARTWLAPVLGLLAIAAFPGAALAAPPMNTAAPQITIPTGGASNEITNPSEGRTLTSTPGTWSPTQTSYKYQWMYDCTVTPANAGTQITGATNATYQIAHADIGHTLCLQVTAGGVSAESAATGAAVVAGTPLDQAAPTISGITQDQQQLTATPGVWRGTDAGTAAMTFAYRWDRCNSAGAACAQVSGQTSPIYNLTDGDVGHTLEFGVIATNSAGTAGATTCTGASPCPAFSKPTAVITPGNTGVPTISGTAQVGQTLTEGHGTWVPSGSTYGYQWESCDSSGSACSPIAGATSQTYPVTSADAGHTLAVQETASQSGASSSASSAPTGVVPQPVSANTGGSQGGSQNNSQGNGQNGGPAAPTGSSTAPAAVTVAQLRGMLDNALAVHGGGGRISAVVKHGGYSFTFSAPSAGTLAVSWYRRLHGRTVLIAKATVRIHTSGKVKVELVLTSKGRKLLKGAGKTTLTAQAGFTPVGHSTTSTSTTITLKK